MYSVPIITSGPPLLAKSGVAANATNAAKASLESCYETNKVRIEYLPKYIARYLADVDKYV